MELGLHCDNVAQQNHETEEQETQLVTLSCTLLVLDRQWSAGIGLPSNFKETDFDMAQVSRVRLYILNSRPSGCGSCVGSEPLRACTNCRRCRRLTCEK